VLGIIAGFFSADVLVSSNGLEADSASIRLSKVSRCCARCSVYSQNNRHWKLSPHIYQQDNNSSNDAPYFDKIVEINPSMLKVSQSIRPDNFPRSTSFANGLQVRDTGDHISSASLSRPRGFVVAYDRSAKCQWIDRSIVSAR
jgi:hypothetical protein